MKRTLFALALVAGAMVVSSGRAYAHHSFAATYFEDKTQKIEGNLVQFLYRNPHSFVHVEAPEALFDLVGNAGGDRFRENFDDMGKVFMMHCSVCSPVLQLFE